VGARAGESLLRANSHEVEGQTVDLSLGGARVESDLVVQPGKQTALKLIVTGRPQPVLIEQAQVQDSRSDLRHAGRGHQQGLGELEQLIEECIALDERGDT